MPWNIHLNVAIKFGSVGIATRYRLDGSRDRIPVEVLFSAPIQTIPGAHPVSCTIDNGSFQGVKHLRLGVDHPPPSKKEVKERVEFHIHFPSRPSWRILEWTLPLEEHFIFHWNIDETSRLSNSYGILFLWKLLEYKEGVRTKLKLTLWRRNFHLNFSTHCI